MLTQAIAFVVQGVGPVLILGVDGRLQGGFDRLRLRVQLGDAFGLARIGRALLVRRALEGVHRCRIEVTPSAPVYATAPLFPSLSSTCGLSRDAALWLHPAGE